ncbi:YgfZ/GcvT domain-containing protein [Paracandidimonas soli]|uniref:Uncharacterized protein n=1 Tax=Paracandidimonas soli TaxID=1917182 RepID=A0A4R3VD30_9BURK|nr:folate-binding protein YgfZ [Paracandidimonas soli]TCV01763.1 hypothetical protein EV686_102476 [Paracandidimonas soli]
MTTPLSAIPAGQAVALPDLSVISFSGADAATFLQGQLSNDIKAVTATQAHLAGYCTAKGRLLATLIVWAAQDGDGYLALVKSDIADALVKRLSMFVLRAKVVIRKTDAVVAGVLEDGATVAPSFSIRHRDDAIWILAPSPEAGACRWWRIGTAGHQEAQDNASYLQAWQSLDIRAGLPWITQAVQDLFIPQTLNLDLIGGVSFTKGCYPGQEVVARSHYRGTIKRRMACGQADSSSLPEGMVQPGTDIFDALRPGNPCGRVINVASDGQGKLWFLLEVQLADLDSAKFRLGSADGAEITIQALPYEIRPPAQ